MCFSGLSHFHLLLDVDETHLIFICLLDILEAYKELYERGQTNQGNGGAITDP